MPIELPKFSTLMVCPIYEWIIYLLILPIAILLLLIFYRNIRLWTKKDDFDNAYALIKKLFWSVYILIVVNNLYGLLILFRSIDITVNFFTNTHCTTTRMIDWDLGYFVSGYMGLLMIILLLPAILGVLLNLIKYILDKDDDRKKIIKRIIYFWVITLLIPCLIRILWIIVDRIFFPSPL